MYLEEKPYLKPLPVQNFRFFLEETRTVDDAGLVQVGACQGSCRLSLCGGLLYVSRAVGRFDH
jgi:hypothetical protein